MVGESYWFSMWHILAFFLFFFTLVCFLTIFDTFRFKRERGAILYMKPYRGNGSLFFLLMGWTNQSERKIPANFDLSKVATGV